MISDLILRGLLMLRSAILLQALLTAAHADELSDYFEDEDAQGDFDFDQETDANEGGKLSAISGWGDLAWDSPYSGPSYLLKDGWGFRIYCEGQEAFPTTEKMACPGSPRSFAGLPFKSVALSFDDSALESFNVSYDRDACGALERAFGEPTSREGKRAKWLDEPISMEAFCSNVMTEVTVTKLKLQVEADENTPVFTDGEQRKLIMTSVFAYGTLDGFAYNYHAGFGAGVMASSTATSEPSSLGGDWSVKCESDPMDDSVSCSVHRVRRASEIIMSLFLSYDGTDYDVCVGADHYPGKDIQIRVDSNQAHSVTGACFSHAKSAAIMDELRSGTKVVTRYQKWPYESWLASEFTTDGFGQALKLTEWLYTQTKDQQQ